MMLRKPWGLTLKCLLAFIILSCASVKAESELFDLNDILVRSQLYVWNRISDLLDIMRCGIAGGPGIGAEIAVTEYAQLGAYVTKENGVDFPHFLPPLWLTHYYQQKPIFNRHEGFYATASFGPWRTTNQNPEENSFFPRGKWDLRAQAALGVGHLYVNFSADELQDFLAGIVGWDPAGDDQVPDPTASRRPADQFGRGVCNILFGVFEIPANIIRVNNEEGDMAGISKGLGLGVWRFVCREVVGVVELVTFPFGWEPIIQPEYMYQKEKSTTWRVQRPAFHRRY